MTSLIKTAVHTLSHKEKIPFTELTEEGYPKSMIANFINCYLSQLFPAKNYQPHLWHYFYLMNILANFNTEASYYLLNKKIIGRFYGFFLDKQIDKCFPDILEETMKLKDISDCVFKKLGPNEIKTGGFRSRYLPKKKLPSEKNEGILEYFWKTIADLIIYCKFPNENTNNQPYCYTLSELEAVFLKPPKPKFLFTIWESADNFKTAKSIAKIYAYISKDDYDFSLTMSKFYCSKIFSISNDCTVNSLLKGLWSFIGINDSLTKSRVTSFYFY